MADKTIMIAPGKVAYTTRTGLAVLVDNLHVPIIQHGREVGTVLRIGQQLKVTEQVWDEQVIAQQMFRDGILVVS